MSEDKEKLILVASPKKEEASQFTIRNMSRVTLGQEGYVRVVEGSRYKMVQNKVVSGIHMMETSGSEEERVFELQAHEGVKAFEVTDGKKERKLPETIDNPFMMQE